MLRALGPDRDYQQVGIGFHAARPTGSITLRDSGAEPTSGHRSATC